MSTEPSNNELSAVIHSSPLGDLELVASRDGLRAILWPADAERDRARVDLGARSTGASAILDAVVEQLDEYFAGERTTFDLPLDPVGTEFQRTVWQSLTDIPYGETTSYGKQAAAIGRPSSVRAVAAANGKNPISIVVPCHRVVGADGSLTGFAGGLESKAWLLEHEANVHRET